ncbi:MAG: tRNA lysidine(34) synthetase TilS [Pseudomonadota bacterium]
MRRVARRVAGVNGGLPRVFAEEMGRLLGPDFPKHIGLAVSGGGDSMAMLYLAAPWAKHMGLTLWPVTIDHGLRAESGDEAQMVARACAELGLTHTTLRWHWDSQGNLQDAARRARHALIDRWRRGIEHVLFAHTLDDQAETFLLRLARGSGVDGLSAMADRHWVEQGGQAKMPLPAADILASRPPPTPERRVAGVAAFTRGFEVIRPLLAVSRKELRHFLTVLKIECVDDPSNQDTRFERVKMRQALPALEALGITRVTLAATAARLREARHVLEDEALRAYNVCAVAGSGAQLFDVTYDRDRFAALASETQLRLLAAALQFVSGARYRPRLAAVQDALARALSGGATTLHGGYVYPHKACLYICAEYERVRLQSAQTAWPGITLPEGKDIRPLGEAGAAQLRAATDLPARVLWPTPALWEGERVKAAPRLGKNPHWNPSGRSGVMTRLLTSR